MQHYRPRYQGCRRSGLGDGRVYPEYWEYVKALYRPAWESDWIKDRAVAKIMDPCHAELAVILNVREIV